jgi:very-short-patch-repair endonuclease
VFVGRVDLAWPELRIALEYEGAHHAGSREQLAHDRARLNALTTAGWTVLNVAADRMREDRFDLLVRDIRATMAERRTR